MLRSLAKLDETKGRTAQDTYGYNHGTLYGDYLWYPSNGQVGGALVLDGDGDYIDTTLMDELHTAESFTIAAWFKTNVTDEGQQHLLWIGDVGGNGLPGVAHIEERPVLVVANWEVL